MKRYYFGIASLYFHYLIKPAVPLEYFRVPVDDPIERHAHLPRTREHFRVFDGAAELNVIAAMGA